MASSFNGYTGPLSVAAYMGHVDRPDDTAEHTIILLGLAHVCDRLIAEPPVRVRMEMTPEEAEDAARSMLALAQSAKQKRR